MLFHTINIFSFIGVLLILLLLKDIPPFIVIIGIPLFFIAFIYNTVFIWIINKSKDSCRKMDFFSTLGRTKIKNNYGEYFEDKYINTYKTIIKLSYLFPVIFLLVIIIIVVVVSL